MDGWMDGWMATILTTTHQQMAPGRREGHEGMKKVVTVDSSLPNSLNDMQDLPCAESQGPDPLSACQIPCTSSFCINAVDLCEWMDGCTHVAYSFKVSHMMGVIVVVVVVGVVMIVGSCPN